MDDRNHCPNGHQLWESWLGTSGCLQDGCEHRRTQEPGQEVVLDRFAPPRPCGHPAYLGWGPASGCRTEGCEHYLPGIDVTDKRSGYGRN